MAGTFNWLYCSGVFCRRVTQRVLPNIPLFTLGGKIECFGGLAFERTRIAFSAAFAANLTVGMPTVCSGVRSPDSPTLPLFDGCRNADRSTI